MEFTRCVLIIMVIIKIIIITAATTIKLSRHSKASLFNVFHCLIFLLVGNHKNIVYLCNNQCLFIHHGVEQQKKIVILVTNVNLVWQFS